MPGRVQIPELNELFEVIDLFGERARVQTLAKVPCRDYHFPLIALEIGSSDPKAPTLGLFGGVHGLERIGTWVILSYLRTVVELLKWDKNTRAFFETTRLVTMPLVNPAGMFLKRRSNANGVDLMRNSPVRAEKLSNLHLFGGHRISKHLPWYQGEKEAPMEQEAQVLCDFVRREVFSAPVAITLDVHSGYGKRDRLWFPYAKSKDPFPLVGEMSALKQLLDRTYPNHIYVVEPQSKEYITHGDLWDYLLDEHLSHEEKRMYLPLSLELGSWLWIRKNLKQAFSALGVFNPLAPHRMQRTLRRHMALFDFLFRAVASPEHWANLSREEKESFHHKGMELWYGK